jgi:hypothetical protein
MTLSDGRFRAQPTLSDAPVISARCLRSSVVFGAATWALIFGLVWAARALARWCLS